MITVWLVKLMPSPYILRCQTSNSVRCSTHTQLPISPHTLNSIRQSLRMPITRRRMRRIPQRPDLPIIPQTNPAELILALRTYKHQPLATASNPIAFPLPLHIRKQNKTYKSYDHTHHSSQYYTHTPGPDTSSPASQSLPD
jgi:hypothetical protein